VTDERLHQLVKTFGRNHAQAAWDAGNAAIEQIAELIEREKIVCEFVRVPGFLHAPRDAKVTHAATSELAEDARLAREMGFDAEYLGYCPLVERPGVRFANQAKFHPLKYLGGLLEAIPGGGSHVFEQTEVTEFSDKHHGVKAGDHWVHCNYRVIATHVPLLGEKNVVSGLLFQTKISSYSTYAVGARIPAGQYPEASFWDTKEPYDYLRIDHKLREDYAILGGEDHKTGQADDTPQRFERLRKRLLELIPKAKVDHHWSGQVVETNDGLPLIGEATEKQFIATGFGGNGLTFGTVAAMMACDAALKRKNPWADLFDIHHKKLRSAWDYVKENIDYPYYLVKDQLAASCGSNKLSEIRKGQGKIVHLNGQRVACARDEDGKLHQVSPTCTHLGCIVHWNNAESTWDCPCHGSRFTPDGAVIAGPAETPLAKIEQKPKPKPKAARGKKPAGRFRGVRKKPAHRP
jgi:glycine/D-amino acid oxidase-like deaminating enzyme/nitrite reductase/ring-hydroxylating ferredoxin subunit